MTETMRPNLRIYQSVSFTLTHCFSDDNMHGIIEEEEMEDEGSDEEVEVDDSADRWYPPSKGRQQFISSDLWTRRYSYEK